MRYLKYLLAVILPPVGVFFEAGISTALFINVLLTLLGWLPGSVHALWFLTKRAERLSV
jgi:uncharacterized membrane protein YqaE (UPF0057 family)